MAFTFDPGADVLDELRNIAHDQLGAAISDLVEPGDDLVEAIHDCRKRCKKLRGLVRLVRPALGDQYSDANATFRDASRELSPLRDAHALRETFEALVEARLDRLGAEELDGVSDALALRAEEATRRATPESRPVTNALALLRHGESMIDGWTPSEAGFDAVAGGLRKTYARGRRALDSAVEAPTSENFHEYRKRTKYTWYHVRLLDQTAPALAKSFGKGLHQLSDTLGDEHDLAVLSEQLRRDPEEYGGDTPVAAALLLIDGQRADLQRRALGAGARLHAEMPDAFVARWATYWEVWQRFGPQARTGAITVVADAAPA